MFRLPGLTPQPFNYDTKAENSGLEWQKWLKSLEIMFRACRIEDDNWKKDLLLHFVGPSVQQIYETLPELPGSDMRGPLTNIDRYTPNMSAFEEAVAKLNDFFLPKKSSTFERHLLRQMNQQPGENFDAFMVRLRLQAERCDFGDRMEENIKDQIIEKCQSMSLRRELLKSGNANLDQILKITKIFETVAQQEKAFSEASSEKKHQVDDVNKIVASTYGKKRKWSESKQPECHRCGYFGHFAKEDKCPARGKTCNKCGGKDHFAIKCRTKHSYIGDKRSKNFKKFARQDNAFNTKDKENDRDTVQQVASNETYVFHLTTSDSNGEVRGEIGGVPIVAVIDSGSKYNLVSQHDWEYLKKNNVTVTNQRREATVSFKAYGGQSLAVVGVFSSEIKLGIKTAIADFYVVKETGKILIGRDTAMLMGILNINIPVHAIGSDKKKLGTIKDVILDIPIMHNVVPVVQPYRRIPVALEGLVDKKLSELMEQGVIERVNGPAKWISPVVVVPKGNDDVRICIDMRRANEAIERENYPLPTFEDFLPHLAKAEVFSRLDVKHAFHQV